MTLNDALELIGLNTIHFTNQDLEIDSLVDQVFSMEVPQLSDSDLESLYFYPIPVAAPGGACPVNKQIADDPYSLLQTLGVNRNDWMNNPETGRLWKLNQLVQALHLSVGAEWTGIYRSTFNESGEPILLKEAYRGEYSRPEFPLTQDFAKGSNNSKVGLSGKAILVQDVKAHSGAYYQCDQKVNSEFCCPILSAQGDVLGIIDVESFQSNFFTPEKLIQIVKVCVDLGQKMS